MGKKQLQNLNSTSFISSIFLLLYFSIGFVPNWEAVDRIAPQWLVMSGINFLSLLYFIFYRDLIGKSLTMTLKSPLSVTYIGFIFWAVGSIIYAINPTEVLVNLSRQINVLLMYIAMTVLLFSIKNRTRFISWIISLILAVETYAVLNQALEMINTSGSIISGDLKGITANRNITAFSLAIKIPFVLFLIHLAKRNSYKLGLGFILCLALVCLSMIESRASFVAILLIILAYTILYIFIYLYVNKKINQLFKITYVILPLIIAIFINQTYLSSKGTDAISRAATISVSTNDGSVNQRLRYYEDVLTQMISAPLLGVGLGNWKLKSIDYDSKDIIGYVVPYHAHSDFIQLGAELGIIGFILYLGIFIYAIYYVYYLIRYTNIEYNEKVFLFLLLTALGVYSIDANLNFPIARPQVLVVWALIMGLITLYYQKHKNQISFIRKNSRLNTVFLILSFLIAIPGIYLSNQIYKSLKGQMFLLQDFNSNQFNIPLSQIDNFVPEIPNITVTTIPINSVKARYYLNAKKYDKALSLVNSGTKANPFLYYSEILKSQIYREMGRLDSAKVYAKKAFFGLPNNALHASTYINLVNLTRDKEALEDAFETLTFKDDINNWKNYLIIASGLYPTGDKKLIDRAKKAVKLFPKNPEFQSLYRQIAVGVAEVNIASEYSTKGLEFFNEQDFINAAIQFEKALEVNPLDYTHFENAATANYMIGNVEKALDQINVVINDLNPLNGKSEYIKALIFIRMGDPIGACPLLATSRDSGFGQAEATFNQYCR